jgi:endonuclease/exonuclease/phosphatase family metal-dependent hydrolase
MPAGRHAFTAMTFNVRYDEPSDGAHDWTHRRESAIGAVRAHGPDLLAVQEPTAGQRYDLASALDGMTAFDGGFIRAARFDILGGGAFALPGGEPRRCAWLALHDRTVDRRVIFASTHLDTTEAAWLPSARTLHAEIDRVAGDAAVVLAGDFNTAAGGDAHRALLADAGFRDAWYEAGGGNDEAAVTYHGFTGAAHLPDGLELERFLDATSPASGEFAHYAPHVRRLRNYRIDWILVRGSIRCTSALIDTERHGFIWPSDHHPVVASIEWQ